MNADQEAKRILNDIKSGAYKEVGLCANACTIDVLKAPGPIMEQEIFGSQYTKAFLKKFMEATGNDAHDDGC